MGSGVAKVEGKDGTIIFMSTEFLRNYLFVLSSCLGRRQTKSTGNPVKIKKLLNTTCKRHYF